MNSPSSSPDDAPNSPPRDDAESQPLPPLVPPAGPARPGRRICGLETEYAILYQPDEAADTETPPFSLIESILFKALLEGQKAARSLGIKGGYFLENGGLAHLEIFIHDQADTPILELATPECSNSRDLLVYQRAFDALLSQVSERSWKELLQHGYQGRIAFGKNNLDATGTGYGCHENYSTRSRRRWFERLLILMASPVLLLLSVPWLVFILFLFVGLLLVLLLALLGSVAFAFLKLIHPEFATRCTTFFKTFPQRAPRRLALLVRQCYVIAANACLFPCIWGFVVLLRRTAHQEHLKDLTGFLVTRQIFTGSGWLNYRTGQFELSQRAPLTASLAKIVMLGRQKTIFDLKGFLYRPFSLFREQQRLTLCSGDSNLSDLPNLLKVGATMLILDMIEEGASFADLEPRSAVRAFKDTSIGGPWKNVILRSGKELTAIEIQREYLRRARIFVDERYPNDPARHEVIYLWQDVIERITDDPSTLSARLDWAAKKTLLDRAVLSQTNWAVFSKWTSLFGAVSSDLLWSASTVDDIVQGSPFFKRGALRRYASTLEEENLDAMRHLYFQARKIDLRYHEVSCDSGYQRELESEGLIRRLVGDEEVNRALKEPPSDTRARQRSYYIKLNTSLSQKFIQASWDRVVMVHSSKPISLADPFAFRTPTD